MLSLYIFLSLYHFYSNADQAIPKLLLISFDGFRYDYIDRYNLSVFKKFIREGGHAERVKSCFTTVTFPNHFSLVTGLYEERHGIVSNQMYDPDTEKTFNMENADDDCTWWEQNPVTMPIWIHNQRESSSRSSGTICWVSSRCNFSSRPLDRHIPCRENYSNSKKIETVFSWLTNSTHPSNFVAVYFDEPDKTGHSYGPISDKMNSTLHKLESVLENIDNNIKQFNLTDSLNVIIVSDHGMTKVDQNNSIVLSDYIDNSLYKAYGSATVKVIFPNSEESVAALFRNLSFLQHYNIYQTSQLWKYHYSDNIRLGSLVLVADPGYLIFKSNISQQNYTQRGNHGYLNSFDEMETIFMGKGPSFKPNSSVSTLKIVDVFPLLIELLNLDKQISMKVSSINKFDVGSLQATLPLLSYTPVDNNIETRSSTMYFIFVAMACTVLLGIVTTFGIIKAGWNMFFPGRWFRSNFASAEDSSLV